jgi:hypothetical protein
MFDFARGGQLLIVGLRFGVFFQLMHISAYEINKQGVQVTPQKCLTARYGQNIGQDGGVEASLEHHQTTVDAAAAQIRRVFAQINRSEPLHHAMVGPQHHLGLVELFVAARSTSQALRVEVVQAENVNGSLQAQIVQLAVYVQSLKVLVAHVVQHYAVDHALAEDVFVLRQAYIVEPFFKF